MTCYESLSIVAYFLTAAATAIYAYFAWGQWNAIRHQAEIANKALLLTQRPKLRVRNVSVDPIPLGPANPNRLFKHQTTAINVAFSIVNVGNTVAQICKSDCLVLFANNPLPMPPLYVERPPLAHIKNIRLNPGESYQVPLHIGQPLDDTEPGVMKIHFERLYVMGYVDYMDGLNLTRRTAFCRWLAATARYFVAEENPDYEYED